MKPRPKLLDLLSRPLSEKRPERIVPFPDLWESSAQRRGESDEEEELDDFDAIPRVNPIKRDEWSVEETRKWLENRKARFPLAKQGHTVKDDDDYDMGVMERKLRMKLELLKGNDETDHLLKKRARYLKELATVQRAKRKTNQRIPKIEANATDQQVAETPNPKADPTQPAIEPKRPEPAHARTKEEIIAHLRQKVEEDNDAIKGFTDNKLQHSTNYRYIQNTLFSDLVLDDVLQERENIMSILEYIYQNNYLQD